MDTHLELLCKTCPSGNAGHFLLLKKKNSVILNHSFWDSDSQALSVSVTLLYILSQSSVPFLYCSDLNRTQYARCSLASGAKSRAIASYDLDTIDAAQNCIGSFDSFGRLQAHA